MSFFTLFPYYAPNIRELGWSYGFRWRFPSNQSIESRFRCVPNLDSWITIFCFLNLKFPTCFQYVSNNFQHFFKNGDAISQKALKWDGHGRFEFCLGGQPPSSKVSWVPRNCWSSWWWENLHHRFMDLLKGMFTIWCQSTGISPNQSLQWWRILPTLRVGDATRIETPHFNGFVFQDVGKGS